MDSTPNKPSKFRAEICVEINDDARATYNTNSQIKYKASMLKSSSCDYSNVYILVGETLAVPNTETAAVPQIDNAKDIDVVMTMYNLLEYSDN